MYSLVWVGLFPKKNALIAQSVPFFFADCYFTVFDKSAPALNLTTFFAAMFISLPV